MNLTGGTQSHSVLEVVVRGAGGNSCGALQEVLRHVHFSFICIGNYEFGMNKCAELFLSSS